MRLGPRKVLGGSVHWREAAWESDITKNGNPATYYGYRLTATPGVGRLALNAHQQSKEDFFRFHHVPWRSGFLLGRQVPAQKSEGILIQARRNHDHPTWPSSRLFAFAVAQMTAQPPVMTALLICLHKTSRTVDAISQKHKAEMIRC